MIIRIAIVVRNSVQMSKLKLFSLDLSITKSVISNEGISCEVTVRRSPVIARKMLISLKFNGGRGNIMYIPTVV
jgi:hypothetical protein